MAMAKRMRAHRITVTEPCPVAGETPDYADAFEISRGKTDTRTAEQWAREAFGKLSESARRSGMLAHRHVLGFELGPWSSPQHLFGWSIVSSKPERLHLQARGARMVGHMVWRIDGERFVMSTFVHYKKRTQAALIWAFAQRIHHNAVPDLLGRAA